ncbi:MAG: 23S rRNA (pseudouridine(1915)-N(3))-methyltransferase RlmH [Muribaculaceae bacterium]|nr:23S rRNA (pseudouridine(1915)-N(3))-methyltransferase RlmH [Muribaculaceae bacterium]
MKLLLIAVGKTATPYLRQGIDIYLKRLTHYLPVETMIIADIKNTKTLTESQQKEAEGRSILAAIDPADYLVLLDERGRELTSRELSGFIDRKTSTVQRRLVMVIGGPYGFSQAVYDRANEKLSLSRMTFNHEMVRLFLVEQIYRAMTILRGEPYHHD